MQGFQPRIFICIWYRSHATAVTCLLIAAKSFKLMSGFKWKSASIFQMDSRKAKLSQSIFTWLLFDDAVNLVMSVEMTNMLAFRFKAKSFAKQNTW